MPQDELLQQLIHNQNCFKSILWIINEKVLALQDSVEQIYNLSEVDYMKQRQFLQGKTREIQELMNQIHQLEVIIYGDKKGNNNAA
jgi:predicted metal-binding transcription factor (methanogenesis marker protein 9)